MAFSAQIRRALKSGGSSISDYNVKFLSKSIKSGIERNREVILTECRSEGMWDERRLPLVQVLESQLGAFVDACRLTRNVLQRRLRFDNAEP